MCNLAIHFSRVEWGVEPVLAVGDVVMVDKGRLKYNKISCFTQSFFTLIFGFHNQSHSSFLQVFFQLFLKNLGIPHL